MTVLIAKRNEELIKEFYPKASFINHSANTSTFKIHGKSYTSLYNKVKEAGYNPFALMCIMR